MIQQKKKIPILTEKQKKLKFYEKKVQEALSKGKVYKVIGNLSIGQVKIELHKRGFIETISNNWNNDIYKLKDEELLEKAEPDNEFEIALLTKMLGEERPIFLWINRSCAISIYQHVPILNKINILHGNFVTKDGLCQCMNSIKRYGGGKYRVHHPRSYIVSSENYKKFYSDYELTIATSVVLYLNSQKDVSTKFAEDGTVSLEALDWAFQVIIVYSQQKEDDCQLMNDEILYQHGCEWRLLYDAHNALIHHGKKFKICDSDCKSENDLNKSKYQTYMDGIKFMSGEIKRCWPWRQSDGYKNLWLLKPSRTGEGQGIVLTDNPDKVKQHMETFKYKPYIIQKYIEKPLLVYGK